jgi:hypothetical protein
MKYITSNAQEYTALTDDMSEWIGSDCWSVVVNGECLFNFTNKDQTFRQKIIDGNIRDSIVDSPHSTILVHINRSGKDATIDVHMFSTLRKKVTYTYDSQHKTYTKRIYNLATPDEEDE